MTGVLRSRRLGKLGKAWFPYTAPGGRYTSVANAVESRCRWGRSSHRSNCQSDYLVFNDVLVAGSNGSHQRSQRFRLLWQEGLLDTEDQIRRELVERLLILKLLLHLGIQLEILS